MRLQIRVRDCIIGGGAPIAIQSMTNTDTRDIDATVAQILALEEAGCEIVRFAVFDMACAQAIPAIRARTHIPLVADVHFDYRLAIAAVENGIDKLRINPGNIGGEDRVRAVTDCARMHRVPIRVGVNGGSMEKDILARHGRPTPEAMLESALHHVRMLEEAHFYDTAISLKASSVRDMVLAYRLAAEKTTYPLHIGLTEAGMGEDAIVKSAIGIGALLLDGIGDTLRVSITGDPVEEIRIAKRILRTLGIRREGVEIISCPTCGRCKEDLVSMVRLVEQGLHGEKKPLTVAVMGCAVNGPGEAREADIGIAFGDGNGVVFKRGEKVAHGDAQAMIAYLLKEARDMLRETI